MVQGCVSYDWHSLQNLCQYADLKILALQKGSLKTENFVFNILRNSMLFRLLQSLNITFSDFRVM